MQVLFAEPFRTKKPIDFPRVAQATCGGNNRVRYLAHSAIYGMLDDLGYVPSYTEAVDILKWAGVVYE